VWAARRIARKFGLRHLVIPPLSPSREVVADYWKRIGYVAGTGKAREFYFTAKERLDMGRPWIPAFAFGVGRPSMWSSDAPESLPMTAEQLLVRMKLPTDEPFRSAMDRWLMGLPEGCDAYELLDLVYVEQRSGCWASPNFYGAAPYAFLMNPFAHWRIHEAQLRLPLAFRGAQGMVDGLIRARAPDLLFLPFNEWSGPRRALESAKDVVRRGLRRAGLRK